MRENSVFSTVFKPIKKVEKNVAFDEFYGFEV